MSWIKSINARMHQGRCPTQGSIGECAAIHPDDNGGWWIAALYIWDDNFNDSARVAQWFFDLGAGDVIVLHALFDSDNGDRDGKTHDGARAWEVRFSMPHQK